MRELLEVSTLSEREFGEMESQGVAIPHSGLKLRHLCCVLLNASFKIAELWTPFSITLLCSKCLPLSKLMFLNLYLQTIQTSPLFVLFALDFERVSGLLLILILKNGLPKPKWRESFCTCRLTGRLKLNIILSPDLLPGMYSMPIHAVPKLGTNKHQLVTDHSARKYALNAMIAHDDIAGVMLDNMHDLANGLHVFRHRWPHAQLHLWQADVSEAYHHMPMHSL
jgi:hypothetical protein